MAKRPMNEDSIAFAWYAARQLLGRRSMTPLEFAAWLRPRIVDLADGEQKLALALRFGTKDGDEMMSLPAVNIILVSEGFQSRTILAMRNFINRALKELPNE